MRMKKVCLGLSLLFLVAAAGLSGCAYGNFGTADMGRGRMSVPSGLEGQDKEHILKTMGIPDSVVHTGGVEYWDYGNRSGYFVLLFGRTVEKDLILDFRDGRVAEAYLVDKGSSLGVISSQGAVGG